ncbi:hypothetical protein NEOLEDRAFT_1133420 [Neolentinus lepideus HHB14362 ss-1]|uniref:F-box domain-containing protein n=1 Tax=Neolentinus lepideus HHB14362 ss-1 TaxID=1314782 RepID=A0A165SPL8_9AGAM|nr:hypothetical protein NEOLEDRAFT_1133420 [Neolentinus lepideus HHB14362 ss-1]
MYRIALKSLSLFAPMTLVTLPPEILDILACNLDCRKDLLSLALSCRYLYSIVSHLHLQYHEIRCRLNMSALWTRLAHPEDGHAGLIRSLTILPNNLCDIDSVMEDSLPLKERLPEEYQEYTPLEDDQSAVIESVTEWEEQLNMALKRMKNLRQFRWFRDPPVVESEDESEDDLWSTLNALGTIRDLSILDLCRSSGLGPYTATWDSFLSFRGLSSLDLKTDAYDIDYEMPDATALLGMLINNCPDLERLCLFLVLYTDNDSADADMLLRHEGWPNLRILRLAGFSCTASALSFFFASHASLEDICLPHMMPGRKWAEVTLPDGALPNLRKLECWSHTAAAMLKSPGALTKLRELRGIDLYDKVNLRTYFDWDDEWWAEHQDEDHDDETAVVSPWRVQLLEGIRNRPSITSLLLEIEDLEITKSDLLELAAVAPQITHLVFQPASYALEVEEWLDTFSHFPHLRHLIWLSRFFSNHSDSALDQDRSRLRRFVDGCPALQVIGDPWHMAVIIERGKSGEIKWVKRREGNTTKPVLLYSDETMYTA